MRLIKVIILEYNKYKFKNRKIDYEINVFDEISNYLKYQVFFSKKIKQLIIFR